MMRTGPMPLLTCLVFSLGLGVGVAWKTGLIPVEIGEAQTGQLEQNKPVADDIPATLQPESDDFVEIADAATAIDDPAIFEQQTEPEFDEIPRRSGQPELLKPASTEAIPLRSNPSNRRSIGIEDEWAEQTPPRTPVQPALAIREQLPLRTTPREINAVNQAGHREPAPITNDATASESPIADELKEIDKQIAEGATLVAHRALSKLYWNQKQHRAVIQSRLDETSKAIFFSPQPHFVEPYVIEANDQLRVIASKYQLSWEYLAKLNKTDPRRIQLGQKLKVVKGPFAAIVDLKEYALTIHLQGYYVKRYDVGIGKDGSSPLGKFTVLNKVENPQYTGPDGRVISADDPSNPLGERWIDLGDSYGIHGTIDPDSIGKAASRGCIRLRDKDVIEVYDFLVKGSEVQIRQ